MSRISDPVLRHLVDHEAYPDLPGTFVTQTIRLTDHVLGAHSLRDISLEGEIGKSRDGQFAMAIDPEFPEWCLAFDWDFDTHRAYRLRLTPVW